MKDFFYLLTHTGVVMQVDFDVTANNSPKSSYQVVDLSRIGTTNGISDTDTIHTDLVNCLIDGE